jgi:hypothetical protein
MKGDRNLSSIEILPVRTPQDMRQFIRLPWKIYKEDPCWVPPLIMDMKKLLDRSKNPFFEHSTADFFLARRNGEYVGRIAAILNNNHNRFHSENIAFFGFFESVNDTAVSDALLDQATQWAKDHGTTEIRGPMNYSTNDTVGLLIEGFDTSPFIMMTHNPPYYANLIEKAGFEKSMDLYAWYLETKNGLNPKIARVGEKVLKDEGIRIRTFDKKRFDEEVPIIQKIYNDAWSHNWGFVPMTDAEFAHMAKDLKAILDPRIVLIAEKNEEPVAFSLMLPDFNDVLKRINGRLFPFGLPLVLYHSRNIIRLRNVALGIVKKVQNSSGLGAALYYESFRQGVAAGYRICEFSWTLETNQLINRSMRLFGANIYKRYRVYGKGI